MRPITIIQRLMLTIAVCVLGSLLIEYGFGLSKDYTQLTHKLQFGAAYLFCFLQIAKLFFTCNAFRFLFKNWLGFTLVFLMLFQLLVGWGLETTPEYDYLLQQGTKVPLASVSLAFIQCYFLAIAAIESTFFHKMLIRLQLKPVMILIVSFLTAITIGTLLLKLPKATAPDIHLSWINSFFTAVSAVCITGLTAVDTGSAFSAMGQVIILVLIQLGGLGIITFTAFMAVFSGEGLKSEDTKNINALLATKNFQEIKTFLFRIIVFTLLAELLGAVILFKIFQPDISNPFLRFFYAVFHSVSAYCNAGFSLWSESVASYSGNIKAMAVFYFLILMGSIGYPVLITIPGFFIKTLKGRLYEFPIHTKTVLKITLLIITVGSILFFLLESNGVMSEFNFKQKILTSIFMPITTRTCGFQTVDISGIGFSTVILCSALMFIGGSPASSAGGMKTATIAVIFAHLRNKFFGKKNTFPTLSRIEIIPKTIKKAYLIFGVIISSALVCAVAIWFLENKSFDKVLFESVSATATVGLSMNVTDGLQNVSKVFLTVCMLIGRIAPAFIVIKINRKYRRREKIILG
ncbi:MAG TPA: potassium transporter TrkG [Elusimicrobiales bacterium]|nr:potassium transporter TrkG [Elusimicrobiales bacterium]